MDVGRFLNKMWRVQNHVLRFPKRVHFGLGQPDRVEK